MLFKIAFIIVTIGFLGIPGTIYDGSDVQPSGLLFGWLLIASKVPLKFNRNLILPCLLFLVYICFLSIALKADLDWKLFFIYCIGFVQLALYLSLFTSLSQKPSKYSLEKILYLIPVVVFSSAIITLFFPDFLSLFKSRTTIFYGFDSYRGASGVLPEPGAVGFFCGSMILAAFFVNSSRVIKSLNPLLPKSSGKMLFNSLILDFFASKYAWLSLVFGILSTLISFSVTSLISFVLLIGAMFIPSFSSLASARISTKFLSIASVFALLLSLLFMFNPFPESSRGYSLISTLGNNPLELLSGDTGDASAGDRANSTKIGLTTPLLYPFGYGINGIRGLTSNCNSSIVNLLQLQCESNYNSSRNHNSFANFTQDGGLIGLFFLISLLSPGFNPIYLLRYSFPVVLIVFYLVIAFIALPSPLGSSAVWIVIASLRHFLITSHLFNCDIN